MTQVPKKLPPKTRPKIAKKPLNIKMEFQTLQTMYLEDDVNNKINLLLLGESGSGKSFLARTCPGPVHMDCFDPGATKGLQKEIRERVVKPSAKVLRYYLLDFVTSPAIREHFHIPEEASAELLEKLYYEEVSASEAIVAPSRLLRERGARAIRLRRDEEDGSWRIVEFPKFEVSGGE